MPRALLSVSDKTGLVEFARALCRLGYELVSTGGTARSLADAGLPVKAVSEVTGFPEMLDGRVKTLHPAIHGGILARRGREADMDALRAHGILPVDVVAVNLYPFARAAERAGIAFDDLIEEIDIGGPSLVRAAAKNFLDVLVVVDPASYPHVIRALEGADGPTLEFRFGLARAAFDHTACYDRTIATTLQEFDIGETGVVRRSSEPGLAGRLSFQASKVRDLRYGENPHQRAALYSEADEAGAEEAGAEEAGAEEAGIARAKVLQGKELSYTNLLDVDAAARIALEFSEPAAAVIKHTNPCGVATGARPVDAYIRARECDALAAFGGIVGLNRPIDAATAREITSTFIEAVIAPAVDDAAIPVLAQKQNMRVVIADLHDFAGASPGLELRSILGGVLIQERDRVVEAGREWPDPSWTGEGRLRVVTRRAPTSGEWKALRFAWRVCAHVKSNSVVFTGEDRTLAIGAGQMSRVDAVKVAVMKARGTLEGSVAASDAFFPFRDGLDALAAAGATAVVQPGGSVRDREVIAAADEHGVAMVITGRRHFRH